MTQISCIRKIEFDAAHRVIGHENKCRFLHGHRYVLEAEFAAKDLDHLGRVIDFGEVKRILKSWIDENLDHTAILSRKDKPLGEFIENYTEQRVYYIDSNPTAENIAAHLFTIIIPQLFQDIEVEILRVRLYETPNCYVEVAT